MKEKVEWVYRPFVWNPSDNEQPKKMTYQEYIDLGFKRTDIKDCVEFRNHGYYGYYLQRDFGKHLSISCSFGELDKPTLYYKGRTLMPLSVEQMKEVIKRLEAL